MVAGDRKVVSENVRPPGITLSLPRTARNLENSPPEHADGQVIFVLAGDLAGFAAGAGGGVEGEGVGHFEQRGEKKEGFFPLSSYLST